MSDAARLQAAITKGIAYIATQQEPDGGFVSFSSPTKKRFRKSVVYRTTFVPALILDALHDIDDATARHIRQRVAAWLMWQKSETWSFNYWAKKSPERARQPYPDDLDDTFCALAALYRHDKSLIDGAALAKIVNLLVATESQIGGPYRTWLVPAGSPVVWQDVDVAVNSNILYFLRLVAEPLPNIEAFIEQALTMKQLVSPYYPSVYPLWYYAGRAYRGRLRHRLMRDIARQASNGHWGTPLQTALSMCALQHLSYEASLDKAVEYLLCNQHVDGSWPAEAFCIDPARSGKTYYHGAAVLTTALVVGALTRCVPLAKTLLPSKRHAVSRSVKLHEKIVSAARRQCAELDAPLRDITGTMLDGMVGGDTNQEIVLLPYFFATSLQKPSRFTDEFFEHLGLASLYGWLAYTIYDDFLDDEGDPQRLPTANVALRHAVQQFACALPGNHTFTSLVQRTFDTIDGANSWEVYNCRFKAAKTHIQLAALPQYDVARLAERSWGHALGPMGVLMGHDASFDAAAIDEVKQAMWHYLIARQIADDMHDWHEDVRAGRISYVTKVILQSLQLGSTASVPFETLLPRMERQFWQHELTGLCREVTNHTGIARQAARRSGLLMQTNIFTTLLDGIDASMARTLSEQSDTQRFLQAYRAT